MTRDVLYAKKDREGKTVWMRVGIFVKKANGKFSVKLDVIPASGWDGWLTIGDDDRTPVESKSQDNDMPF